MAIHVITTNKVEDTIETGECPNRNSVNVQTIKTIFCQIFFTVLSIEHLSRDSLKFKPNMCLTANCQSCFILLFCIVSVVHKLVLIVKYFM